MFGRCLLLKAYRVYKRVYRGRVRWLLKSLFILNFPMFAPVAQLDRATDF